MLKEKGITRFQQIADWSDADIDRIDASDLKNVEKAVNLSTTKYCGVSANYLKSFPITHEIIIEES